MRGRTEAVSAFVRDPVTRAELSGLDMVDTQRMEHEEGRSIQNDSDDNDSDDMRAWAIYRANRTEEEKRRDDISEYKTAFGRSPPSEGCSQSISSSSSSHSLGGGGCTVSVSGWGNSQHYPLSHPSEVVQEQVTGIKCVSEFPTLEESPREEGPGPAVAHAVPLYVEAVPAESVPIPTRSTPKKYYVVLRGKDGFHGIVSSWECASLYTSGTSNATVKKYATLEEAHTALDIGFSGHLLVGTLEAEARARLSSSQSSGPSPAATGHGPM